MTTQETAALLQSKLSVLGSVNSANFADRVLTTIREWMQEVVTLPPRDTVINATSLALDRVFAGVDTPGPDMIVEPALKALILGLVGFAYDAIAKESI